MSKTDWAPFSIPHGRDEAIDACRWLRDKTDLGRLQNQEQLVKALHSWAIPVAEMMSDKTDPDSPDYDPNVEGAWLDALSKLTNSPNEHEVKVALREQLKWRRAQSQDESTLGGPAEEYPLSRYALDIAQSVADSFIETLWITQYVIQVCADIPQDSVPVYYRPQYDPLAAQGTVVYVHDWANGVPVNYLILKPGSAFRTEIVDTGDILGLVEV